MTGASTLLVCLALDVAATPAADAAVKPNVVFILVDDLGWSDLACYGSDFHETPNIDALARESVRFTNAYAAAAICSPTRSSVMTGKYPARLGMTIWHEAAVSGPPRDRALVPPESVAELPHSEVTLAEVFKRNGYFTAHVGKWHLGKAAHYPETQGYDVNIGGTFWGAPSTFYYPFSGPWSPPRDMEFRYVPGLGAGKEGDYLTDRLTDRALEILDDVKDRPFLLSLWFYTVHSPIEGRPDLVARYREKVRPNAHHHNPDYAAMVNCLDANVGRVLRRIDELGLRERTVVVLTSDNGGVDIRTRSGVPTSNYPLRSGKGTLYEGGIRVPLLVRWPGLTRAGSVCRIPVSSQDFYPTLVSGLRLKSDPKHDESIDGVNLMPILRKPAGTLDRSSLYFHYPHYYTRMTPASAMRRGRWKLLHFFESDRLELYDLERDPGESEDLAKSRPRLTERLEAELDAWRKSVGARLPVKNPAR